VRQLQAHAAIGRIEHQIVIGGARITISMDALPD